MQTVNVDEKLELAKELNLKEQISLLEYRKGMFDLTFKRVTIESIRDRLTFKRFRLNKGALFYSLFFTGLATYVQFPISEISIPVSSYILICLSFFVPTILFSIRKTRVISCWVDDFKYDIPYGGMLALKEAGEKGIKEHRIFYPTWSPDTRLFDAYDPIITGIDKHGHIVEIYAWNENDVYDEPKEN